MQNLKILERYFLQTCSKSYILSNRFAVFQILEYSCLYFSLYVSWRVLHISIVMSVFVRIWEWPCYAALIRLTYHFIYCTICYRGALLLIAHVYFISVEWPWSICFIHLPHIIAILKQLHLFTAHGNHSIAQTFDQLQKVYWQKIISNYYSTHILLFKLYTTAIKCGIYSFLWIITWLLIL